MKRWEQSIGAEYRERARDRWFNYLCRATVIGVAAVPTALAVSVVATAWVEEWMLSLLRYLVVDHETLYTIVLSAKLAPGVPTLYGGPVAVMAGSVAVIPALAAGPMLRRGWTRTSTSRISGLATNGEVETTVGTDESAPVTQLLNSSMGRSISTTEASAPDLLTGLQRASAERPESEQVVVGAVTIAPDEQGNVVMKPGNKQDNSNEVVGERVTRTLRESQAPLAGFEARFAPIDLSNKRIGAWRKRSDNGVTREILADCRNDGGQFAVTVVAVAVGVSARATVKTLLQDAKSYFNQTPGVSAKSHIDSTDVASLTESPPEQLHPNAVWDDHRPTIKRLNGKRTPVILKEAVVDFLPSETDKDTGGLGDTGGESQFPTGPDDLDSGFLGGDD
ncbi:hypothetical protein [Halobaculum gomorrense]|nr:hypothetical protein [Halobaculum gomorrense]